CFRARAAGTAARWAVARPRSSSRMTPLIPLTLPAARRCRRSRRPRIRCTTCTRGPPPQFTSSNT
ncbi:hypothetical protein IWW51_002886, partial [Coemansia sp. RSA 2702]